MPVIDVTGIQKAYGVRTVLSGIDFTLRSQERVGLVGRNGCGKSTFGRILAGLETPDAGQVARRRGATIEYLDQEPVLPADQSLRDIVLASLADWNDARLKYEAATERLEIGQGDLSGDVAQQAEAGETLERLGGWDRLHEAEAIIHHLGIEDPTRLAGTLSGGEGRRVALARALVGQPSLVILDEPTNHLDVETIEWLEDYLINRFRGALLLVTHDRYVLDRVATRTIEIHDGSLTSYNGGYATYLEARAERLAHAERSERNRQNFLRRELEWLRRQPKARSTKQKARVDRAEEAMGQAAPTKEREAALALASVRQGKILLSVEGVTIERGGHRLVEALDLAVGAGQRIGIVGPNGAGKTSLLLAIQGLLEPVAGELKLGATAKIGVLDQQRSGLEDALTIREALGDRSHVEIGDERLEVAAYLERFLFDRREQRVKVSELSGGERARVCLARLLAEAVNLVLLDEPTNDLDVSTLAALESMLVEFGGSAIIVSHDRWFLDRVATSILAFEGEGQVTLHAGNYSAYRERTAGRTQASQTRKAPVGKMVRASGASAPTVKKLSFNERHELDGLFDQIEVVEAEAARLQAQLADPETYQGDDRGDEITALKAALDASQAEVARLTERWEELEARREATE